MSYFEQRRQVVHGESESLKVFLMSRLQPWRWPVMLKNGGIRVEKGGKPVANLTLNYQLTAGDVVIIDDAYGLTWMELIKESTKSYRDYVYAPTRASDDFVRNKTDALLLDPRAFEVKQGIKHLQELVASLTMLGVHPIRHIILVAHANAFGDIMIPTRDKKNDKDLFADYLSWEILQEAVREEYLLTYKHNPNPVIVPRPENERGKFMPCALIIRGCRAGIHEILLKKIRAAFGYMIDIVVMPKYFDAADFIDRRSPTVYAAAIEYFMHDFIVTEKTKLDRKGVIAKLAEAKFKDWLGGAMPESDWRDLVPANVHASGSTKEIRARIPGRDREGSLRARFDHESIATQTHLMPSATKPTEAEIRKFLTGEWMKLPQFTDREWPVWLRLGLSTFDELVAYFTFEIDASVKKSQGQWPVRAVRYAYTVRTPLIQNGTLICNYYPKGEKGTLSRGIDYNDVRIFGHAKFIPKHFEQRL